MTALDEPQAQGEPDEGEQQGRFEQGVATEAVQGPPREQEGKRDRQDARYQDQRRPGESESEHSVPPLPR